MLLQVFDVFKSNSHLSRKKPDLPMTHICIAEYVQALFNIETVVAEAVDGRYALVPLNPRVADS
jgi:hypothetical protein